jgi:uncharacterized protein YecE (DUF72 family)
MEDTTKPALYVGTSGWAYKEWKPAFYPEELKQKDFLRYYATQLNATEVNYTFRQMVSEKAVSTWLSETPPEFRFILKAHNAITHIRRLKNTEALVQRFCQSLQQLSEAGRMGPVFFQLPPNFKADMAILRDFLQSLPPGLKHAWEFRNQSWFSQETYQLLADHNGALCIAESEERETPRELFGNFLYFRFRKPEYSAADIETISKQLQGLSRDREVYAFFKHEDDPKGALWAKTALSQASH